MDKIRQYGRIRRNCITRTGMERGRKTHSGKTYYETIRLNGRIRHDRVTRLEMESQSRGRKTHSDEGGIEKEVHRQNIYV